MENEFHALPYKGLTTQEAAERTAAGQCNKQPRAVGKTIWQIIASNLFTLFNLLNLILAIALISVGAYRNLLFMGVIISNTVIGTVQELRAKKTIDQLRLLSMPAVEAIRDGQTVALGMEDVVLDDLIIIRQGEQLCADGEVISGAGAMNESLLTGESEPVDKLAGDTVLSGSFVTEGTMYVRITKVGAESYASKLMLRAKEIKKPHSELMQSMQTIVRLVGAVIVPLGGILLYKQLFLLNEPVETAVVSTVAAVIGMIPEGLVLLTSVALAVGVVRLGKRKTLVQELYGIESLARVDTLCLDKTGTITAGTMEVVEVEPLGTHCVADIEKAVGNLVAVLDDNNATFVALRARFHAEERLAVAGTVPFSSARKWSAASFEGYGACVIGAAEFILGDKMDAALTGRIARHAEQGRRVLLLCHSTQLMQEKALPEDLEPCGLVILSDVLRPDAADTLAYFAKQGVDIKIISGDNPLTVMNMAGQAGLANAVNAVDATTLDTPQKLEEAASRYTVFGRVTPEQKKDLVLALKAQGHTVGMVGDGVNDIPALKASDCSIAMAGGSDAARRVSQLTLLDANFAAVPYIVGEGRRVINNITRAASLFLVKTTFSFMLSFLLIFLHQQYPFAPIQMTLISSLTVGIPSFFLALEPNNARVKGNFLQNVLRNALPGGLTVVCLICILWGLSGPLSLAQETVSTIATWATGFSGLVVLFITCLPLSFSRAMLLSLMALGFFGAVMAFGPVFYLVPLQGAAVWVTLALALLAIPLMCGLRWLVKHQKWL